jgi:hypothetical protein
MVFQKDLNADVHISKANLGIVPYLMPYGKDKYEIVNKNSVSSSSCRLAVHP